MSDKVLSFVMRDTGLESLAFMAPSLVLGGQEVKLGSFGIGLEGSLTAVDYELGKSDNMDILGIQLVDWIERSVNEYRLLKPLDIRVKLPLLPQES
ncbi:hypothetical protein MUP46_03805 [Patescibacteria group bacterium]|nr:hypothetical protein [Patescibacteria group bacterium]